MSDNILVPLDGSPFGERILPLATKTAQRLDIPLELARVHAPTVLGYTQDMYHATLDAETDAGILDAEAYLAATARSVIGAGARARITLLYSRSVADAICARAQATHATMIAMTTHGRTGLTRSALGSVADGVVRQSHIPVLLWRSTAVHAMRAPNVPFRTVLVPLDGTLAAESILPHAASLALLGLGHMVLLRVLPYVDVEEQSPSQPFAARERDTSAVGVVDERRRKTASETAQEYLTNVASRLRKEHPRLIVDTRVLRDDDTGAAITRVATDARTDLVAMTSKGDGPSRLIVGSTVDAVLRERKGAMLLLRAPNQLL